MNGQTYGKRKDVSLKTPSCHLKLFVLYVCSRREELPDFRQTLPSVTKLVALECRNITETESPRGWAFGIHFITQNEGIINTDYLCGIQVKIISLFDLRVLSCHIYILPDIIIKVSILSIWEAYRVSWLKDLQIFWLIKFFCGLFVKYKTPGFASHIDAVFSCWRKKDPF